MKAQRRHDLQSNTLAEELNGIVAYVQDKSQAIIVVLVAVVVVLGVAWYWKQSAQTRRAEGWQAMLMLMSTPLEKDPQVLDKMEQVAASYGDPKLKAMAYVQAADRLVHEAAMTANPTVAQDYRQRAEKAFQAVLSQTPDQQMPVAIAQLGLGRMAADRGDFDAAKRYYEMVGNNDKLAGTPLPAQASAALTALEAARKVPPLAPTSQPTAAAVAAPAASSQPASAEAAGS